MDFGSLQRRTKRYWRKTKWCSVFVLFTLANLLITICISAVWSSQESQVFAKLSVNTCVMLACSFLVIKQRLDANKSIRSEQLAFEGLTADFKGVEASNDRLRMELSESQLKCIDLQTKLDAATLDLEKARRENDGFREELKGAKANEKADLEKALEALKKELAVAQEKLDLIKSFLRDEITAYDTLSDADVLRLVLRAINERDWLRKKLEGAEASSDRLKGSLKRSLTNCRKLRKELSATKRKLEDTQKALGLANLNADNALYARDTARDIAKGVISERNGLRTERDELLAEIDKLKRENFALREELGDTDDALVESCSQLASVCSKLDGLQSKLSKLVAERNQLQYEVYGIRKEHDKLQTENDDLCKKLKKSTEKVDWFRREYFEVWRKTLRQSYNAKRQVASLESILKNLDEATEIADLREKLKMVINGLSAEDSRE